MPTYYIRGEVGKDLGPERVSIGSLRAHGATVRWETLAPDTLRWTATAQDLAAGGTKLPEIGQRVSLYEDERRIFTGHVTQPRIRGYGVEVQAEGAWWWLRRPDAVSEQDDGEGNPGERPAVKFALGNIATHIASVIGLARDGYGLPVRFGTASAFYNIPVVSYSLSSLGDVIARLLEWCPDAVAWFDHSAEQGEAQAATTTTIQLATSASAVNDEYNGREIEIRSGANAGETRVITDYLGATRTATIDTAWTTTPSAGDNYSVEVDAALNITRRGDMAAKTYTLGTDVILDGFEFHPRVELEVSKVDLPYVDRSPTTGRPRWQLQTAGSYAAGKRQIVPISGPELADFLPHDDFDSFQRLAGTHTNAFVEAVARIWDTTLAAAVANGMPYGTGYQGTGTYSYDVVFSGAAGQTYLMGATSGGPYNNRSQTYPAGSVTNAAGSPVSTAGKLLLLTPNPPQWWLDQVGAEQVYVSGKWHMRLGVDRRTSPYTAGDIVEIYAPPAWLSDVTVSNDETGFVQIGANVFQVAIISAPFGFQGYLVPAALGTSLATDYKAMDYGFLAPPAGLAANLLAASNWTPWEGRIPLKVDQLPSAAAWPFEEKVSLAGTIASAASAGALPRAVDFSLPDRRLTVELGPPPRNDYRTLVNRTRRNPQDNIVEL